MGGMVDRMPSTFTTHYEIGTFFYTPVRSHSERGEAICPELDIKKRLIRENGSMKRQKCPTAAAKPGSKFLRGSL